MSNRVTIRPACGHALRKGVLAGAIAAALALPQMAAAFEADTGNEDLSVRWDNTVRVNLVKRAESQDKAILANPNYDDGDRNVENGGTFMRFDLLSELDVVWKKSLGFRVTGAGWYDGGYAGLDNDSLATENHLVNGLPTYGLPDYSNRYAKGPSGEFLDAFAFARFNIGEAPVNIKVGQTTVYWGESLLLGGAVHGVSYSQNPIDIWKAYATPGAEAKELFRPRVGFNIQSTVTDTLSIAGQYFFNWQRFSNQAYRYPESGTYLSVADPLLWGGESFIVAKNPFTPADPNDYLRFWRGKDITPEENTNNYGLAVRWSPDWLGGTLGAYYRKTYDMTPQLMATPGVAPSLPKGACVALGGVSLVPAAAPPTTAGPCIINTKATNVADLTGKGRYGEYNIAFNDDIDIFGLSLSRQVFGLSLGAELSYRKNMSLLSDPVFVYPKAFLTPAAIATGAISTADVPKHGTPGATGDTMHGLVNLLGVVSETPLFDTASWSTELTWMTWLDVNQNEAVFKGRKGYDQIDAVDKNYFGLGINFTPTWFQVFPSVDFYMPLSWSQGFANSAVTAGGNDGGGTFGIGVAADIRQKYRFDLKYVGIYGDYSTCPRKNGANPATCVNGAVDIFNGTSATLSDRDFVSLTFKTTF